jgi:hypothetical protein
MGHLLSGSRGRGLSLLAIISVTLGTGLFLGGQISSPKEGNPLSWVAAGAGWCSGALYFPASALAGPISSSATAEIGSIFVLSSGTMGLLAFFDIVQKGLRKRTPGSE